MVWRSISLTTLFFTFLLSMGYLDENISQTDINTFEAKFATWSKGYEVKVENVYGANNQPADAVSGLSFVSRTNEY